MAEDRNETRRTVLRTAGGALAATVGAAGLASASNFQYGDCVRFVADAWLHEQGCPHDRRIEVVGPGTTATVYDTCTDDQGRDWAFVSLQHSQLTFGWVQGNALEHC